MVKKKVEPAKRVVSRVEKRVTRTEEKMGKRNVPEGVMIIGVVLLTGALLCLFLSLGIFSYADPLNYDAYSSQQMMVGQAPISQGVFVNLGLLFIIFGIVSYLLGRAMLRLNNKARLIVVLLLILSLIVSIYNLVKVNQIYSGSFQIVLVLILLWYLLRKKTAEAFK